MKLSMDAKNKLFKRFKAGDGTSLLDLLESEREGLYDYLLRMTGQVSRSSDTVDEVYQSLTETDETLNAIESCVDLRICLYKTARKFNADIWNADTAKLVNSLLEGPGATESSLLGGGERQTLAALDRTTARDVSCGETMREPRRDRAPGRVGGQHDQ